MNLKRMPWYLALLAIAALSAGCRQTAADEPQPEPPAAFSAELAFDRAAAGDTVTLLTPAGGAADVQLSFGPLQLTDLQPAADGLSLEFTVPAASAAGPVRLQARRAAELIPLQLDVIGTASARELLLVLQPDVTETELSVLLAGYGLAVSGPPVPLNGSGADPVCYGQLALVEVPDGTPSVGELLAQLEAEDVVLHADPKSEWGLGSAVSPLLLNGTEFLRQQLPGHDGAGITIAVLDTGVSSTAELGERLLQQYPTADRGDLFGSAGHGTAAAVLAAGSNYGVAPAALLLPVQVCDAAGRCPASEVVRGVCFALSQADPAEDGLVLSLSLGGDTEVRALTQLLASAAERGAVVVAAGGNEAAAPPHWPAAAAADTPALLAVAALEVTAAAAEHVASGQLSSGVPLLLSSGGGPLLQLELTEAGANGFIDAQADRLNWYDASGQLTLLQPATALRLVLDAPGSGSNLRFSLDGQAVETSAAQLLAEPLLVGNVLLQAMNDLDNDRVELLIDPVPGSFSLRPDDHIELLELSLITVAAAPGFSRGDWLSLAAPGVNLDAVDAAGAAAGNYTGTSFATPQVAGAAAVLLQQQRLRAERFDAAAVTGQLTAAALPLPGVSPAAVGAGRLDLRFLGSGLAP